MDLIGSITKKKRKFHLFTKHFLKKNLAEKKFPDTGHFNFFTDRSLSCS